MSEAVMWKYLKPKLEPLAETIRLTDRHLKGLPDLLIARRTQRVFYPGLSPIRVDLTGRSTGVVKRDTGLVEMKFVKEGAKKIGLRPDQAIFAFNWAKVGYAGILVREGPSWWHFLQPWDNKKWIELATGSKNAWRECTTDCTTSFDVTTHGPEGLAPWLLSQLFDRV